MFGPGVDADLRHLASAATSHVLAVLGTFRQAWFTLRLHFRLLFRLGLVFLFPRVILHGSGRGRAVGAEADADALSQDISGSYQLIAPVVVPHDAIQFCFGKVCVAWEHERVVLGQWVAMHEVALGQKSQSLRASRAAERAFRKWG